MKLCAAIIVVIVVAQAPALAGPVACSTSFQGYRVCSGPGGYTSTETPGQGMTIGQESDGSRWTTSRWAMRGHGESYSDVILRLAEAGA